MIAPAPFPLPARLTLALLASLAFLTAFLAPHPGRATANAQGLVADVSITYDIRPEEPEVRVLWELFLENTGPPSYAEPSDPPYYHDSVSIFTLGDGSTLRASGPEGQQLPVSFLDSADGLAGAATISFDRLLRYGDTYSLSLEYEIPEARNDYYLVGPHYVFLPAYLNVFPVATFRSSTLFIIAPPARTWEVSIEGPSCVQSRQSSRTIYECPLPDPYAFGATVEVIQPSARQTTSSDIPLGEGTVKLTVTNFGDNAAWSERVRSLTVAALPILEEVMGSPYSGPDTIRISQRGQQELFGYAGTASCNPISCLIGVSPTADDMTTLHELAHLWSDPFQNRWLAEGLAVFASLVTAERLGLQPDPPVQFPEDTPPYPLDNWGLPRNQLSATPEERLLESQGYDWSNLFFQRLEQTIGLEGLKATNGALAGLPEDSVDSRRYMDALEDATGGNSDDLFRDWVFPPELASEIDARRQARDRLAALHTQAEPLGLIVPQQVQEEIAAWRFAQALDALDQYEASLAAYIEIESQLDNLRAAAERAILAYPIPFDRATQPWDFIPVQESLGDAEEALAAYVSAKEALAAPHSAWQQLGLWGKHPNTKLNDAALRFAAGDFTVSLEESQAVQSILQGADGAALQHLFIGIGILVAVLIAGTVLVRWVLSEETSPGREEASEL